MKRLLILFLILLPPVLLQAQSSASSKKAKLEKEIAVLESQLRENSKKNNTALSSLTLVRKKVSNRKKLLSESEKELNELDGRIKVKEKDLQRLQARMDTLSAYYTRLVHNAYRNRDSRVWYMYILSSENIGQGVRRYNYLKSLSSQMSVQGRRLKEMQEEIRQQKAELESLRTIAARMRDSRKADLDKLKKEEKAGEKLVSQLKRDKNKYQQQLASKRKQVEALNRQLSKMISSGSSKKRTDKEIKLSKEFADNCGKLPWPVEGPVVESFGQHYHPVYKAVKLPFNNGVNIAVNGGTAVKAVFDGEVRQVIVMPGYNKCVLVQHGDYFTFYCKLGSVSVKAKDMVKTGQTIGTVDSTSGENQFHFQLWEGRTPKDPEIWLR